MATAAARIDETSSSDREIPFLSTRRGETICVVVSAVCYFLAIRYIDLWPIALLAPMPLLAAAFAAPTRTSAALCAFLPAFIGNFGEYSTEADFLSFPIFILAAATLALALCALVMIARIAARRWNNFAAALVFPILYAALSFLFARTNYNGTWASPAYRMDAFLPLLQIASVTGIWGVIFAMSLPASAIAFAWYRAENAMPWRMPTGVALAIFVGVLIFGVARLATADHAAAVRIAMISSDHEMKYSRTTDPAKAAELLGFYASQIPKAAAQGALVVVMPEKIVGVTPEDRDALVKILADAASSSHVWIIAGVNEIGAPHLNAAWIFSPDGAMRGEYDKHYFVQGFEAGYTSGDRIYTVDAPWGKTGVAICKDLDYPWFIRAYGQNAATLMLVPAWDWVGPNAVMHERMSVARGVENGFAMARAAKTGFVTAHDAYGATLVSGSTFDADPAMVVADVPIGPGPTLYTRYGDWFGWLSIVVSIGILIAVLLRPRETAT